MTLQDAIEQAAEKLPENYQIILTVEKGFGGVQLLHPDANTSESIFQDDDLATQITTLIVEAQFADAAIKRAAKP